MFRNVVLALSTFSMVACGGGGSDTNSAIDAIDQSNELLTDQSSNDMPANQVGDVWVPEYCSRPPVSELGGLWAGTITLGSSEPICEYDAVLNIDGFSASGATCDMSGSLRFTAVRTSPNVNPPLSCEASTGDIVEIAITQTSLLESILQGAFTIVPEGTFITADIGYPLRFTPNPSGDAPAGDNDINSAPVPYSGLALQLNQDGTMTHDDESILFESELTRVE